MGKTTSKTCEKRIYHKDKTQKFDKNEFLQKKMSFRKRFRISETFPKIFIVNKFIFY